MKYQVLNLLFFVLLNMMHIQAFAQDCEVDGIYFNRISTTEFEVTGGIFYSGNIVIPSSVTYKGKVFSVTKIGKDAFLDCSNLTSVTIPNSVMTIGDNAFRGCTNLSSITIPNSVTSMGYSTFADCSGLKSVDIGNGVKGIGGYAFYNCTGLSSIIIPNNVTSMGIYAFYHCTGLKSVILSNTLEFISPYAFGSCGGLTSLNIPNSVTSIGERAFVDCVGLTTLVLPNNLNDIGSGAFDGCLKLTSLVIPNSVTTIEEYAFHGCNELNSVVIGKGIEYIGDQAFKGCYNLSSLYVLNSTPPKTSTNSVLHDPEPFGEPIYKWTVLYVPQDMHDYGIWAKFYEIHKFDPSEFDPHIVDVKSFTLTYIIDGYIYQIYELKEGAALTVESAPTKEGYTFSGWSEIPKTMPAKDVTVTGSFTINKYNLTYMVDGETYKTVQIEFGKTITPEAEPTKEGYTFSGWSETLATMPAKDVTVTGSFTPNKYTLTYMVDGEVYKTYDVEYEASITPEPAPIKDGYTFSGWSTIPSTMPAKDVMVTGTFTATSVNYVDKAKIEIDGINYRLVAKSRSAEVLSGSTKNAGDVNIPASVQLNGATYSVTSISTSAFYGCKELTSVSIPGSVTSLGESIFSGCSNLASVSIPDGITEISNGTFWGCEKLESVTIPNSVKAIGEYAFLGCSSLKSLIIPSGVTNISKYAFQSCKGLTAVNVPGGVSALGDFAFANCDNLETVTFENGVTSIGERAFMACTKLEKIDLPKTLEFIGVCAFAGSGLKKVDIPNSVITLSEGAFVQCDKLEEVELSEGIKNIGTYVFQKCNNLKSVTIPGNFKALTEGMFIDCSNLAHVEMKEGVESIGLGSFFNCTNLQSISIPKSVTTIGKRAFEGCDNLTSVTVLSSKPATLASSSFPNASKATLCVPKGSYSSYKSSAYWNSFAQIVEPYYTLTYRVDNEVYKTIDVDYGESITPEEEPTKEGYTFSGWSGIPATMPAKDVTVTGTFTKGAYKLLYVVDGETYKTVRMDFGNSITAEKAPEKEGYTFSGWSEIPATMPAKDVTVTGSFTINKYRLTYIVDGATYSTTGVEYGATITPEEEPTKEGYTFSGWSEIPATMPANDVIVTGSFIPVDDIKEILAEDGNFQIYTLDGTLVGTMQKGVNIIRYSNGKVKKVLVK